MAWKIPMGTEMLNEGLQTKGSFKMEHFSAGGCFKWVSLVPQMTQRVLEENCHIEIVTRKRNIYLELWKLSRKVEGCQEGRDVSMRLLHAAVLGLHIFSKKKKWKYIDYWDKGTCMFLGFGVFSSILHMSQHGWLINRDNRSGVGGM